MNNTPRSLRRGDALLAARKLWGPSGAVRVSIHLPDGKWSFQLGIDGPTGDFQTLAEGQTWEAAMLRAGAAPGSTPEGRC